MEMILIGLATYASDRFVTWQSRELDPLARSADILLIFASRYAKLEIESIAGSACLVMIKYVALLNEGQHLFSFAIKRRCSGN